MKDNFIYLKIDSFKGINIERKEEIKFLNQEYFINKRSISYTRLEKIEYYLTLDSANIIYVYIYLKHTKDSTIPLKFKNYTEAINSIKLLVI